MINQITRVFMLFMALTGGAVLAAEQPNDFSAFRPIRQEFRGYVFGRGYENRQWLILYRPLPRSTPQNRDEEN